MMSNFSTDSGALWRYQLDPSDWTDRLVGYKVEGTDGEIGKVDFISTKTGTHSFVVDAGSWLRSRKVMLPAGMITRINTESRTLFVDATKEQVKNAPEIDEANPE